MERVPNQGDYPFWAIFLKCYPAETFQLVAYIISTTIGGAFLRDSYLMGNDFVFNIADGFVMH